MYIYMAAYVTVLRYIKRDTCTKMRARKKLFFERRKLLSRFVSYLQGRKNYMLQEKWSCCQKWQPHVKFCPLPFSIAYIIA